MKKYTHAWIAMMAIKRLEEATLPATVKPYAETLVNWFKNYRDFVISGAWYPDEVFHDMATSHGVKYEPNREKKGKVTFRVLPSDNSIYALTKKSALYERPYTVTGGNCADRCEAFAQSVIDNLKIQYCQEKGSPVSVSNNHLAMRFFILSHYVADCHMPLHCDARPFSDGTDLHGYIEGLWDDEIRKSYGIDYDNNRFFYDPKGYPIASEGMTEMVRAIEKKVSSAKYTHGWGAQTVKEQKISNENVWDYMSSVSLYSYLLAYELMPEGISNRLSHANYRKSEYFALVEQYTPMIMFEAINSVARIWLHVWIKYQKWEAEQNKKKK